MNVESNDPSLVGSARLEDDGSDPAATGRSRVSRFGGRIENAPSEGMLPFAPARSTSS